MRSRSVLLSTFLVTLTFSLCACGGEPVADEESPSEEAALSSREEWASRAISYLEAFKPSEEAKLARLETPHPRWIRVYLQKHKGELASRELGWVREGLLKFHGEWVYLISISSHSHGGLNVAVAVDQNGRLYEIEAHYCGLLRLISGTRTEPESVRDFLATESRLLGGRYKWREISRQ